MKKLAKRLIAAVLGWQVRRLSDKNEFKVIAVAGSIGKTSTKFAIATVLGQKFKVRWQEGNYNDLLSVPLVYFGHDFGERERLPFLNNPLALLKIIIKNESIIRKPYPFNIVVVELGPDAPGQMAPFKKFVKADVGVLTAISPEHMEFFGDIEAVAKEEMVLAELSQKLIYNSDLVDIAYVKSTRVPAFGYNLKPAQEYNLKHMSDLQRYSASAAIFVGRELGLSQAQIKTGLTKTPATKGRMQILSGIKGSTIIDDSYNASPRAMKALLETLYSQTAPQKIALLGNMNELGDYSQEAHAEIGQYCDPRKVDLILTLGPDANKYLAPAAEAKGCKVQTFDNPYTIGQYLKRVIKPKAAILVKGSQNGIFAEETIKAILADPADAAKLVRQSSDWLKIKRKAFPVS